ncbi:unnamed protein product [Arctia plantaginis]|uniref:Uncharacterized protein n=1 Tax=Arctia plantaginis TaxID=874455 RepID=A0A8S0YUK7_ARCPL|nr:unnamed protein product [Arctia plantaginis]
MEVCAHHTNFKLVDFDNLCEVHLQNCLYRVEKEEKKRNVPDMFYYNQQEKKCQYYLEKGKTFEEAVRLYYLEGLKKNLPKK